MRRKNYVISSNHQIVKPEQIKESKTLEVWDEPCGKHKTFKANDILYAAYTYIVDIETQQEEDEEMFLTVKRVIESGLCDYGDKVCSEEKMQSYLKKEHNIYLNKLEFISLQKRYYIFIDCSEYSTDFEDLLNSSTLTI